jgi:hypothetical protein
VPGGKVNAKGLVKPLVLGIEGGDGNVYDLHFSDCSVADVGRDENGGHRADGDQFAIEFHVAFAFENQVNLGELLMVMGFRVRRDVDKMDGGRLIFSDSERAPSGAAGAFGWFDFVEVGYEGFLHWEIVGELCEVIQYVSCEILGDPGDFGDFSGGCFADPEHGAEFRQQQ